MSNPHVADKNRMSVLNLATSALQHDAALDMGTLAKAARRRRRRSKRKSSRRRRRRSKRKSSRRRRRTETPARPRPRPPGASTNSFVPIGEDDCGCKANTFEKFEWLRTSSSSSDSGPECHCQDICYLFGDPHIVTFDKENRWFMQEGPLRDGKYFGEWPKGLNRFWAVASEQIQIEGLAATAMSWMRGVRVAGPFLSGHYLEALNNGAGAILVTWDGKPVLTQPGDTFSADGVTLRRTNRASYLPTDDQLKEAFEKVRESWFAMDTVIKNWKDGTDVFIFEFPDAVDIFMTSSSLQGSQLKDREPGQPTNIAAEIVIRMPPQPHQGGWCGNFNGKKDDHRTSFLRPVGQSQTPPPKLPPGWPFANFAPWCQPGFSGFGLNQITAEGISTPMLDDSSAEEIRLLEKTLDDCDRNTLRVARAACDHLPEKDLRDACVMDACVSEEPMLAEHSADDVVVIKSVEGGKSRQKCQCKNPR